jgi:hypothetical protein
MKIAVISTGRSRCTLLAKYLHTINDGLEFCGEFYNSKEKNPSGFAITANNAAPDNTKADINTTDSNNPNARDLVESTNELFSKENYLVKIISHCLKFEENHDPAVFRLEEYDQIHFIERPDFFDQCCSWEISLKEKAFHLTNDNTNKKLFENIRQYGKYKISSSMIQNTADRVYFYLKIKKYVIDHHIPHHVHTYGSAKMFGNAQDELIDSNLNYRELIVNYYLKEEVNRVFDKYFSYNNVTSDQEAFNEAIIEVEGLRSLQSFANKMTASWNK